MASEASDLHSPQIFSLDLSQNVGSLSRKWSSSLLPDGGSGNDLADAHLLCRLSRPQTDFEAQVPTPCQFASNVRGWACS